MTEQQANALFRRKAGNLLPTAGRVRIDFACAGPPVVSVVMVLHDQFPQTLMMLNALRGHYAGDIELILIDTGSTDETAQIGRYVHGASVMRFDSDIGVGARLQRGPAMRQRGCGAVPRQRGRTGAGGARRGARPACRRSAHRCGGRQGDPRQWQTAGGRPHHLARRYDTGLPGGCFAAGAGSQFRSRCRLLLERVPAGARRSAAADSMGSTTTLASGGFADADLCIRIVEAGQRVVYDPAVVVYHHGADRAGGNAAADGGIERAHQAFFRKHLNHLRFRYIADRRVQVFARSTQVGRRVLFIDDTIPLRQLGSGFVRSNDILQVMATLGFHITIYPVNCIPLRPGQHLRRHAGYGRGDARSAGSTVWRNSSRRGRATTMRSGSRARITWIGSSRSWNAPPWGPAAHRAWCWIPRRSPACAMPAAPRCSGKRLSMSMPAIMREFANATFLPEHHRGECRRGAEAARPGLLRCRGTRPYARAEADAARVRGSRRIAVRRRDASAGQPELRWLRSGSFARCCR